MGQHRLVLAPLGQLAGDHIGHRARTAHNHPVLRHARTVHKAVRSQPGTELLDIARIEVDDDAAVGGSRTDVVVGGPLAHNIEVRGHTSEFLRPRPQLNCFCCKDWVVQPY